MSFPPLPIPQTAAARVSCVIWSLTHALLGRQSSGVIPDWMHRAIMERVVRIGQVIAVLAASLRAGTLRIRRSPAPGGTRRRAAVAVVAANRLPGTFAWLCRYLPSTAACLGGQLLTILNEPEMQELLAISPRARRVLKPLCRMLAVTLPVRPAPEPPKPPGPPASRDGGSVRKPRRRRPRPRAWTPSYNPPIALGAWPGGGGGGGAPEKNPGATLGLGTF